MVAATVGDDYLLEVMTERRTEFQMAHHALALVLLLPR
jgi:hypothetical protein